MADDFSFSIEKHIGVLSESKGGWKTELNLVSWGGRPAKYDIRSWAPDHQKMGKGITLTQEEIHTLQELLKNN
ncbi:MAG: YdbC family protein [Treponema sp.]|nr:YdbC family protein [Treponema sp.]